MSRISRRGWGGAAKNARAGESSKVGSQGENSHSLRRSDVGGIKSMGKNQDPE